MYRRFCRRRQCRFRLGRELESCTLCVRVLSAGLS